MCLGHKGHGPGQLEILGYVYDGVSVGGFQKRDCAYGHKE